MKTFSIICAVVVIGAAVAGLALAYTGAQAAAVGAASVISLSVPAVLYMLADIRETLKKKN